MTMNNGISFVADMGYIVYTYAFNPEVWYADMACQKYTMLSGCVLADENRFSYRKEHNKEYKANRKDYGDKPEHIKARAFWKELRCNAPYNGLHIISMFGAEGDDIVALLSIQEGLSIIGIDKDYYQIPNATIHNAKGDTMGIREDKLPKALEDVAWNNETWLLHLAINGDVSDNIPRLTPKGRSGLRLEYDALTADNPTERAYKLFGDEFLDNLYQVILPYPKLVDTDMTREDVYELYSRGLWYDTVRNMTERIPLPNVGDIYGV